MEHLSKVLHPLAEIGGPTTADMFCVSVTSESALLLEQEEQQGSLADVHQ